MLTPELGCSSLDDVAGVVHRLEPRPPRSICANRLPAVLAGVALAICCTAAEVVAERPIVGAIRWDAWHSRRGTPGQAVERSLSPSKWHDRLPFYARIVGEDAVIIDAVSPETMSQEIAYAAKSGLDYWAFVVYPPENPMSLALGLYLASPERRALRFSLILQGGWMARGGNAAWPKKIDRYVKLFSRSTYQSVLGGRPLVYINDAKGLVAEDKFGDWDTARTAIENLRAAARDAGLRNPYIVAQGHSAAVAERYRTHLALDAIGAYATFGGSAAGQPYEALRERARSFWAGARKLGVPLVPLVSTGFDKRPRAENPVPWEARPVTDHYAKPLPAELTLHLREAIEWVDRNPRTAEARAILIYAWNENDEGGWLVPTLAEGTARLDAIGTVLSE